MGLIPEEVIREVIERADIVGLVSQYVPLRPAGRNFKANCPFHNEKTPSFVVNPDKQIFHCFGCGAGGNVIAFLMQHEHLTFPEAVRQLAAATGVTIPESPGQEPQQRRRQDEFRTINQATAEYYHRVLVSEKSPAVSKVREYLKNRGVDLETVRTFQMGFAPDRWDGLIEALRTQGHTARQLESAGLAVAQTRGDGFYDRFRNRIMFPIADARGQIVAFGGRTLEADNPAKYINSPETAVYTKGRHLYGLHLAKNDIVRDDAAVVVEGYMDCLIPFAAGIKNIVAALGTALTVEQIRLLRRYTRNVILLFDADPAGEAAMMRSFDMLLEEDMDVRVATLPDGHDPDSCVRAFGAAELRSRLKDAQPLFAFKLAKCVTRFGTATIEARAKVAGLMLPTVQRVSNTVLRSEYMRSLAQVLNVAPEALEGELQRLAAKVPRRPEPQEARANVASLPRLRPAERDLLRLLMAEPQLIPEVRSRLDIADFPSEPARRIMSKIFDDVDAQKDVSFPTLMSHFDDPAMSRLISSLLSAGDTLLGDRQRLYRDCLKRLKDERLRARRQQIRQEMELARQRGDRTRLEQLTHDFQALIKTNE